MSWRSFVGKAVVRCKTAYVSFIANPFILGLRDTSLIWGLSTLLPVLVLLLIGGLLGRDGFLWSEDLWASFSNSFNSFFNPAEIFLYSTTLLSPSVAFIVFDWRARRNVGLYNLFYGVIAIVFLVTAVVYALHKSNLDMNSDLLFGLALSFYVLSLVIWYLIDVYDKFINKNVGRPKQESGSRIMQELGRM